MRQAAREQAGGRATGDGTLPAEPLLAQWPPHQPEPTDCWLTSLFALLEAEERGLGEALEEEFPLLDDPLLVDALVWCDMTTTLDGERTTAERRVTEIVGRYGADSVVGRFIRRASPEIFATVERLEAALAAQPRWG